MISIITGPMFSGKTSELIRRIRRSTLAKRKTLLVKYAGDVRYTSDNFVVSHDDSKHHCITTDKILSNIFDDIKAYDLVGIDEGQFFDDLVEVCIKLKDLGVDVIVSGLIATSKYKNGFVPFKQIQDLMVNADSIEFLTAICIKCGKEATCSYRKQKFDNIEYIGGEGEYEARCYSCFQKK